MKMPSKPVPKKFHFAVSFGFVLLSFFPVRADVPDWEFRDAQWQRVSDKKGIQLFNWRSKEMETSAFRAVGVIDAPIPLVLSVLKRTDQRPDWTPRVEEARIVENLSKTHWVEYWHMGTPIVVKDRYFLLDIRVLYDRVKNQINIPFQSATVGSNLYDPKGYVLATAYRGAYQLTPLPGKEKTQTLFTYMAHVNLGGTVPKWLTSDLESRYPIQMVEGLQEKVKKGDIPPDPKIQDFFDGKIKELDAVFE